MKHVRVAVLTERNEGDNPNHLCRVGVSYDDKDGQRRRIMADCFTTDQEFVQNRSVDRKIAAIETALTKVVEQLCAS